MLTNTMLQFCVDTHSSSGFVIHVLATVLEACLYSYSMYTEVLYIKWASLPTLNLVEFGNKSSISQSKVID